MRKMISFKLENLTDKQRLMIDQWADHQTNIQQSLANVVMHIASFTGDADVMDFDIQRQLHVLLSSNNEVQIVTRESVHDAPDAKVEIDDPDVRQDVGNIYKNTDWID